MHQQESSGEESLTGIKSTPYALRRTCYLEQHVLEALQAANLPVEQIININSEVMPVFP